MRALDRTIFRKRSIVESMRRIFSPKSLFSTGAQGVWYDPSDLTTLFEDSAGTAPITTPLEKPVGLMLDKSRGLVLGSELVTNGGPGFSTTTGWAASAATVTATDGKLVCAKTSASAAVYWTLSTAIGTWYIVTLTWENIDAASPSVLVNSTGGLSITTTSTTATIRFAATATSTYIQMQLGAGGVGTGTRIISLSAKTLPGNHAYQSTTTSRPTLSARYNLLTKTEQFDDAAWMKSDVTVLPNTTVAPNGTTTADKLIENNASNYHYLVQNTTAPTGGVFSIYAKAGERFQFGIYLDGARVGAGFDLSSGSKITLPEYSAGSPTSSITSVGNGWYRITINAASSVSNIQIGIGKDGASSYTGDGTSGIYIWGADLRVANDGVNLPSYQRVNTATDYDYAGFPPYLKFDGTDDSMVTNSIDFSATDKMSVFAGVRKIGTATDQIVAQSGIHTDPGVFVVAAPAVATSNSYGFYPRGTITVGVTQGGYPAPITNVLACLGNISGDSAVLRLNGTQAASSTADQGTGNFGNYPLYIGARAGTSVWFNGRLYSLVVVGKTASASEITSTESYINNKTRAF